MRTKTLLLIAAIGAAGVASSMAQVFSVNAVGYVNKTIPANSFAIVSNPLIAATNTVNALFAGVPNGFQVYIYTPGKGYDVATYDDLAGAFGPDSAANAVINPGSGVFVHNPTSSPVTITFVGEVPQGDLKTQLVAGLQIVASQVPQAGTATDLGLTAANGDQIYQFDVPTQKYVVSTFDDLANAFDPPLKSLDVGDGFFLKRGAAGTWERNFSVNTP
jgi:hypothetical protein